MVLSEKQNAATYKPWTPVKEVAGALGQYTVWGRETVPSCLLFTYIMNSGT